MEGILEIYLEIFDDKIINFFTENFDKSLKMINVISMDDFYKQTNEYQLENDIEERLKEIIETTEEDEPLGTFNIKHWVSNRSFGELIDMYESGEIIKPDMQREFVWDSLKCSRLIESIVIGLPIPPLFLLEIDKNKYEIIDGFQRLTTVFNYVNGYPWQGKTEGKNVSAKLSKKISKELEGKSFSSLDDTYKRIIKRSTIPLIEFKQFEPNNLSSKYFIYERINTGSEKLNPMQIRKSLAHGTFIKELYEFSQSNKEFLSLFSPNNIKKDQHVEAILRIMAMSDCYFNKFVPRKSGIKDILNEYCEKRRESKIEKIYYEKFTDSINKMAKIFQKDTNIFRRVEKDKNGDYYFSGNINISILEAFIGVLIHSKIEIDEKNIYANYCEIMFSTLEKSIKKEEDNPFTISTGTIDAIKKRFEISKRILGV